MERNDYVLMAAAFVLQAVHTDENLVKADKEYCFDEAEEMADEAEKRGLLTQTTKEKG